jgi:hypothetical protein
VILGFNGSDFECVVAAPFVAVLPAVVEDVLVLLIVDASTLWEIVFDEVDFKLNGVVMADWLTLGPASDDPGPTFVVEVL